jgi:hypothetical protein
MILLWLYTPGLPGKGTLDLGLVATSVGIGGLNRWLFVSGKSKSVAPCAAFWVIANAALAAYLAATN